MHSMKNRMTEGHHAPPMHMMHKMHGNWIHRWVNLDNGNHPYLGCKTHDIPPVNEFTLANSMANTHE
jgi:hypothetical protein